MSPPSNDLSSRTWGEVAQLHMTVQEVHRCKVVLTLRLYPSTNRDTWYYVCVADARPLDKPLVHGDMWGQGTFRSRGGVSTMPNAVYNAIYSLTLDLEGKAEGH